MRRAPFVCVLLVLAPSLAHAANDCVFDVTGKTMRLVRNCTTDASIVIPNGMTLDGGHHTIVAIDPPGGHFRGAILTNGGPSASIIDTHVTTQSLANLCDVGDARLRGIFLNGASGVVKGNSIIDVNQGVSSCEEGNAIEVWNLSEAPVVVDIANNVVDRYQKSGIVVSGDVDVTIRFNVVGASAAQTALSANAVQIGFGAWAAIEHNDITGNRWGFADAAATGILLSRSAAGTVVRTNTISGNADVAIYVAASDAVIASNTLLDEGPDGFYDIGIVSAGDRNTVRDNDVRGFADKYFGVDVAAGSGALQVE